MLLRAVFALLAVCAALGSHSVRGAVLYGTDGFTGAFVSIDTATGAPTLLGTIPGGSAVGAAYNPITDTMYTRNFFQLFTTDRVTGVSTLVGPSGSGITGLTFNAGFTTLYSFNQNTGDFFTVDPLTGAATLVGNTGIQTPLDLSTDAAGQVYGAALDGRIYRIDTATAAAALVTQYGADGGLTSIAFDSSGVLWGVTLSNDRLVQDLLGTPVVVATVGTYDDIRGLAFAAAAVPVPGSVALVLAGLMLLGFVGRKPS